MPKEKKEIFDVAVIGGGPAGMMAAGRAGELKKKVVLLEKNESLGKKLLLSGGSRSNITNAEFDLKSLAKKYGREGDFLLSPFSLFGPWETINFFEKRGLRTKTEKGKRVFPESDRAEDVLSTLVDYLKKGGVEIYFNSAVEKIVKEKNKISKVILKDGREIESRSYIICTGGKSYPETGSSGEGYEWAEALGHKVEKLRPALVPLNIKEAWPKTISGLSLEKVGLTVFQNGKKQDSRLGELLFTHFGLSGPVVLDLSKNIGELLEKGQVDLVLDLKPDLASQELDKIFQDDFFKDGTKFLKNYLSNLFPQRLGLIIMELSGADPMKKTNAITREERQRLAGLLKSLRMTVASLLGFETAIVTSGGVSLKEIDSKTMRSKLVENLFLAGEIINLQGPSGGYNLQLCWSTGYLAGQEA
ncbi:MAG: NAD(P)/FAD-dependent oxidoreductase [bacterium]|nr:NAD(P)/FAD-dependent oxidoreductase [bacterium]